MLLIILNFMCTAWPEECSCEQMSMSVKTIHFCICYFISQVSRLLKRSTYRMEMHNFVHTDTQNDFLISIAIFKMDENEA
jgi:carbonic anhydrase